MNEHEAKPQQMTGVADVIRLLSYWQIFSLSLGLMMAIGLIFGALFVAPTMLVDTIREEATHNPDNPLKPLMDVSMEWLWLFPFLSPLAVIVPIIMWIVTRDTKDTK